MNNLNSVLIEGTLTEDAKFRSAPKGTPYTTGEIAVNYKSKQDSEIYYFTVEAWAKLAEAFADKGYKGRGVRVVGRLRQDRWEGTNGKREKVSVVAEHIEFKPEFNA